MHPLGTMDTVEHVWVEVGDQKSEATGEVFSYITMQQTT